VGVPKKNQITVLLDVSLNARLNRPLEPAQWVMQQQDRQVSRGIGWKWRWDLLQRYNEISLVIDLISGIFVVA
jgi:hypothetical protein